MNKAEYKTARRLIRENGRYALSWLSIDDAENMALLLDQPNDPLAYRVNIIEDSVRWGMPYTVRMFEVSFALTKFNNWIGDNHAKQNR